jgi:CxxC-x17-CxxC domain-containing protein
MRYVEAFKLSRIKKIKALKYCMNNNFRRDDRAPRQMFQGEWKCAECGAAITELPFEPDPARVDALKCRDCHKKSMPQRSFGGNRSFGGDRGGDRGGRRDRY